ncbi:MAG: DUF4199 domain-containing protein [Crocinitomicaceae bacterium]|jgi:hypothetical protein
MKNSVLIGVFFAFVWGVIKFLFHTDLNKAINPFVLLNIFFLLTAIALGLFFIKKKEGYLSGNIISDFKKAMGIGLPYTLIVSGFIYYYYATFNPMYVENKIQQTYDLIDASIDNPKKLVELKKQKPEFEVMSKEQLRKELKKGPANMYSAKATGLLSLLSMMLLTTFYSLLISLIYRKILFKRLAD